MTTQNEVEVSTGGNGGQSKTNDNLNHGVNTMTTVNDLHPSDAVAFGALGNKASRDSFGFIDPHTGEKCTARSLLTAGDYSGIFGVVISYHYTVPEPKLGAPTLQFSKLWNHAANALNDDTLTAIVRRYREGRNVDLTDHAKQVCKSAGLYDKVLRDGRRKTHLQTYSVMDMDALTKYLNAV